MNYIFLFYCFLSVVLITGDAFFLYSSGQPTTGVIYFLGSIVAVIFFGFRWFKLTETTATVAWPPAINYCPDLLSLATVQGTQVCIDTVGVAQQGGIQTSDGTQTGDQYVFNLFLDQTGSNRATSLCNQAKEKQVTWEGVWDGSVCANVDPPKPGN